MNKIKRFLALVMVLCMMLSAVPFSVFAAENTGETEEEAVEITNVPESGEEIPETPETPETTETPVDPVTPEEPETMGESSSDESANADIAMVEAEAFSDEGPVVEAVDPVAMTASLADTYRILHLDCGRKYFTKDWIIALINEMDAAGFTHLELAIGNDGLRFLLDDMAVTAGKTTYASNDVKSAIQAANKAYSDFGTNELTQAEMDEIITHAQNVGIQIIPLLNNPGHMNAIVSAIHSLTGGNVGYGGSATTIDLENETAVAFTQALVQKYINYFAAKRCNEFNMGADEYANDVYSTGSMGFGRLVSTGKYNLFVNYVNEMANMIKNAGMVPMAFNDGFYFNGNTSGGTFDSNIMVCFWTSGWGGYKSASASDLRSPYGHEMINTNGDFYYVLGKSDQFDSNGYSYASKFSNTGFMSSTVSSTVSDPRGSMFCIWCDYPAAETETQIAANTRSIIRAMGARMQGLSIDNLDVTTDVPGGFKADGSIHVPEVVEVKIVTGSGSTTMKVEGTATLSLSDGSSAVWKSSDESVVSLASAARSTEVTGTSVTATANKAGTATITATVGEATYQTTLTVSEAGVPEKIDDTVTLQVGGTDTRTQKNVNNEKDVDTTYLDENIATVTVTGVDGKDESVTYTKASPTCNTLISSDSDSWKAASEYYYTPDGTNYYPLYAKRSSSISWSGITYSYTYGYSTDDGKTVKECGTQKYTIAPWDSHENVVITIYTKSGTEGTPASTTITFAGVNPGTTYVTVGNITYKIVVEYKTETINAVIDQSTTVNVSGEADTSKLDTSIAMVSIDDGIMTVTGLSVGETEVTVGDTIYTIKVTEEDLSQVTGLTVEFWITNQPVTANGVTSMTINASDSGVYSQSGILFSSMVPATGTQSSNNMDFWKGTRLASDNKQTNESGVDKTTSGTDFTYIRYWNGSWAYSSDGKSWANVESGDQIVAYYLQRTDVTDEITTQVADWGPKKANWRDLNYLGTQYVLLDYTVKYESGEETPSSFPTDKSLGFHCKTSTAKDGNYYRTLGMIRGVENANYEVYMITVTPTSDSTSKKLASTPAGNTSYTYAGTEVVAWAATQGDLDNSGLGTYTSISGRFTYSIGGEPSVNGLEIYRQQGMKVTFYVRAKVTEDSLSVHYIDQTANQEFYSYNIAVKSGTLFNENIGLADPWKGNLANGSVTNLLDKTQTVSADLSTMPAIGAQYRYSDYTCVNVGRSEDGKDVYLYYTFNNTHSFVVDFGLPVKISTSQISDNIESLTGASITGAKYGSAEINGAGNLVYTPTKMLRGTESLTLTITENGSTASHQIYIYPATTVYYEEGFATYSDGWTATGSKGSGTQATQVAGNSSDEYGYDKKYADESTGPSNGSQATTSTRAATADFAFTGTGVDIYANCTTETGWLMVHVKNGNGSTVKVVTVKLLQVNTALNNGTTGATSGQNVNGYNVPVASITGLPHGNYTVTLTNVYNTTVNLDGFRIYGTLATEPDFYKTDLEDNPTFIELRDQVLAGLSVTSNGSGQVNAALPSDTTVALVASSEKYTQANVDDLLKNGPKNEIYLQPSQALVLNVTTAREVQIGLKALNAGTSYTINGSTKNISTSTDMFYTVQSRGASGEQTITITNTGSGILSVTKLKVCDDPNAVLGTLSEEDLVPALLSLGFEKNPEGSESTVPFLDVAEGDWFYDAVKYVYENGLMYGTASDMFSPNSNATRGMIVTILYRESGSPDVNSDGANWWSDARVWAMENGISDGTNMDANITREQMAAMLYRYAKLMDADVSARGNLDKFSDREQISGWAMESVQWAVGEKIIAGRTNGTLDPQGLATRAEVAAMLMRFDKKLG